MGETTPAALQGGNVYIFFLAKTGITGETLTTSVGRKYICFLVNRQAL